MADAGDIDVFAEVYKAYATQDNTEGTGKEMTRENFVKMCNDCNFIYGKVTDTDVDIVFSKVKDKSANTITVEQYKTALEELVAKGFPKDLNREERNGRLKMMLRCCHGRPSDDVPKSKAGGIDRLTDASKYTGSYKDRFDAVEPGKGRGIEGREDTGATGYVAPPAGNYDKKQ